MRSIPFKLVCLLGMNEGEYPRPSVQSGFDLLGLVKPRRGDRSRRDDDRYLFLEALLSVRSRLYISYVGRSVQDNSERFPSTLVSELQDYCDQYFELDSQINGLTPDGSSTTQVWTINHRLQAFHSAYYLDNAQDVGFDQLSRPLPKSYNAAWENLFNRDEPNRQLSASTNEAVDSPLQSSEVRRLDLSEIIAALVNPLRHYYRRMGVDAPWLEEGFEDSEPFNLNGFEEFSLKQSLLSTSQSETLQAQIVERWELADYLPQAPFDRHLIAQAAESVASIRAELPEPDAMSETLTTLNLGSWRVDARFIHLGSSLQAVTLSRNPAQALFALWVQHVFWQLHCARDPNLTRASDSVLYMQGKHWVLPALTEEDADLYANGLLEEFGRSDSQTICFLPKTAFSQLFESSAKASLAFWGSDSAQFNIAGEQQDFFWQRYCLLSGQSVSFEDDLPSMEGSVLFQQLRQQVDQIKELSL